MEPTHDITTLRPTVDECLRSVERAQTSLSDAAAEIVWQIRNKAWEPLAYRDWDHMREEKYGGAAVIVPRADRPELVAALRREGQTQAQIADTIGVGEATVHRDLKLHMKDTGEAFESIVDSIGRERPTTYAPRQPRYEPEPDIDTDPWSHQRPYTPTPHPPTQYTEPTHTGLAPTSRDTEFLANAAAKELERRDQAELDRGRYDTCSDVVEALMLIDGGARYAEVFLRDFYPFEHVLLANRPRLSSELVDNAIEFLTTIRTAIK